MPAFSRRCLICCFTARAEIRSIDFSLVKSLDLASDFTLILLSRLVYFPDRANVPMAVLSRRDIVEAVYLKSKKIIKKQKYYLP